MHVTWSTQNVLYVDAAASGSGDGASWAGAYDDLQEALTATAGISGPIEIRVAQGVYRPRGMADEMEEETGATFFVVGEIAFVGGYAGLAGGDPDVRDVTRYETVLSGDLVGDDLPGEAWDRPSRTDNCRQVVTVAEAEATIMLDGFTVTGAARYGVLIDPGDARLIACRFVGNGSAGVSVWAGDVVLADCLFERNGRNTMSEGGLNGGKVAQLTDCAFIENNGGAISGSETLSLLRCSFVGNTEFIGAAAINSHGDLTARQCLFKDNRSSTAGSVDCKSGTVALTDCVFNRNISGHTGAVNVWGTLVLVGCEFSGNSSRHGSGAVTTVGDMLKADGCLFVGNSCESGAGAVANQSATILRLSKCTFAGNRGRPTAVEHAPIPGSIAEMDHCIVWNGPDPFTRFAAFPPTIVTTYCDIEGGYAGQGNIDIDPCFVDPGCWDANGTPDDTSDDMWVVGDYHLRSQAGHWDRETEDWVLDEVTSVCIDTGDPNRLLGVEPFPNGGLVNLGAYSGTPEASRSYFGAPVCTSQLAGDINGDCVVNDRDRDILMSHWLMEAAEPENVPPSITLLSPASGDEFTAGTPIVLCAETSDPDGRVIRVSYHLTSRSKSGGSATGAFSTDPNDNWRVSWEGWTRVTIEPGRTYTIQAEAMDDQGAKTTTPEIEIDLSL